MPKLPETITMPAGVDLHVHWREPSDNKSETIRSGSLAALIGGYLLAADMSNNPGNPTWTVERVKEKHHRGAYTSYIPFATYAGAQPEANNISELEPMSTLCLAMKFYMGKTTGVDRDYQAHDFEEQAVEWDRVAHDKPIMVHLGGADLEETIDMIARRLNHHMHLCHVNNPGQVKLIARAKAESLPVTCGVCPHHLFKTSHDVKTEDQFAMMVPPLADQIDAEQLNYLLNSGDIDVLETDHAPHSTQAKWRALEYNGECFGVPGSEFAISLLFFQMKKGRISPERIAKVTSIMPARVLGIKIAPDTNVTWQMNEYMIEREHVVSGAGFTPYMGKLAVGRVQRAAVKGKELIRNGVLMGKKPLIVTHRSTVV